MMVRLREPDEPPELGLSVDASVVATGEMGIGAFPLLSTYTI